MTRDTTAAARPGRGDPLLLTPGPLTTSAGVKAAMTRDLGSRDAGFIALTRRLRTRLLALAGDPPGMTCVPLAGSGTFAVEAMIDTLVPRQGKLLVLANGAYGERMRRIATRLARECTAGSWPEHEPVQPARVDALLRDDPAVTHVAVVHCETTSGLLNPLPEIAEVVRRHDRRLLVDAMSAFGALPLDAGSLHLEALAASSNKCLQGVPGAAFCVVREQALEQAAGNASSLSLDLAEQWRAIENNGQWRFTPPVQVLLALDQALDELEAEGGPPARLARYADNCRTLVDGMRALGFETLLPAALQAPIIVTFLSPSDPAWGFAAFYEGLRRRGFAIYPGKLTEVDSFRIGCIGDLGRDEMLAVVEAVREVMAELGIKNPSAAADRSRALT